MIEDKYCLFVDNCFCLRAATTVHFLKLFDVTQFGHFKKYSSGLFFECIFEFLRASYLENEKSFLKNLKSTIHNLQSFSIRTKNLKNFKKVAFPFNTFSQ